MLGLGSGLNYVNAAMAVNNKARPGVWRKLNDVSYTDGRIIVVHVEHFKSLGALIPDWQYKQIPRVPWAPRSRVYSSRACRWCDNVSHDAQPIG